MQFLCCCKLLTTLYISRLICSELFITILFICHFISFKLFINHSFNFIRFQFISSQLLSIQFVSFYFNPIHFISLRRSNVKKNLMRFHLNLCHCYLRLLCPLFGFHTVFQCHFHLISLFILPYFIAIRKRKKKYFVYARVNCSSNFIFLAFSRSSLVILISFSLVISKSFLFQVTFILPLISITFSVSVLQ